MTDQEKTTDDSELEFTRWSSLEDYLMNGPRDQIANSCIGLYKKYMMISECLSRMTSIAMTKPTISSTDLKNIIDEYRRKTAEIDRLVAETNKKKEENDNDIENPKN